jgi:predicted Zn-dependent protease
MTEEIEKKEIILEAIRTFISHLVNRDFKFYYTAMINHRLTKGWDTFHSGSRISRAWALTGGMFTPKGRFIPVGWSGQGSGIEKFDDQSAYRLLKMAEFLDLAQPTEAAQTASVLSPAAAALLIHEAIGHFAEASPKPNTACLQSLGCRLASNVVSLVDNPLLEGGPAHYEFDDDNIQSMGATHILSEGILIGLLHSLASAQAAATLPTANGRAASAWDYPIPRMSNLCCLPSDISEESLIGQAWNGTYIHQLANGSSNGETIQAEILLAERIKKGRHTGEYLTGGCIQEPYDVLKHVVAVGDHSVFYANAICGKAGQLLFNVGTCAPSIYLSKLRVVL